MINTLSTLEWAIIIIYMLLMCTIGISMKKRAEDGIVHFFNGGRNIPWWLAGISMVATTFAADTPIADTGIIASSGIAGNWIWWNFMFSGMFTVIFYSKLWHRSGVLTDIEFYELRYSGKAAAFLKKAAPFLVTVLMISKVW